MNKKNISEQSKKMRMLQEFLTKKGLSPEIESAIPACINILKNSLAVKNEKVVIITDMGYDGYNAAPLLAYSYMAAAKSLGLDVDLILQKPRMKGESSSEKVVEALSTLKNGNIIITPISNRLGNIGILGKSYRAFISERKHRFLSTPSLGSLPNKDFPSVIEAMNTDLDVLKKRCMRIKHDLDHAKKLHITSPSGTDLWIETKSVCHSNEGAYSQPGKGGNIPCGEVYLPPKGKEGVEGKVVIDISTATRKKTIKVSSPITLTVSKGRIADIKGGEEAKLLKESITWAERNSLHPEDVARIAELGIGLNPDAHPIGAMIIDEKAFGTAHVALGSNYWFGGSIYGIIHLDMVFKDPRIEADGKVIKI